jgi:hypothetical protein
VPSHVRRKTVADPKRTAVNGSYRKAYLRGNFEGIEQLSGNLDPGTSDENDQNRHGSIPALSLVPPRRFGFLEQRLDVVLGKLGHLYGRSRLPYQHHEGVTNSRCIGQGSIEYALDQWVSGRGGTAGKSSARRTCRTPAARRINTEPWREPRIVRWSTQ